jgi:hypothetical protein
MKSEGRTRSIHFSSKNKFQHTQKPTQPTSRRHKYTPKTNTSAHKFSSRQTNKNYASLQRCVIIFLHPPKNTHTHPKKNLFWLCVCLCDCTAARRSQSLFSPPLIREHACCWGPHFSLGIHTHTHRHTEPGEKKRRSNRKRNKTRTLSKLKDYTYFLLLYPPFSHD